MSDGWSSYKYIQENGFNHLVVDILAIIVTNNNGGGGGSNSIFVHGHQIFECTCTGAWLPD